MISVSFAFRFAMAWCLKPLPILFPDEYIYSSLARSLWHGQVAIRGVSFPFRPLLEPIIQAPAWALPNSVAAYHLIQGFHSLLMSLTAIPIYILGRKLSFTPTKALLAAALTLTVPEMSYAGYITTEATAYLLFACTCLCGCICLANPKLQTQLLFVFLAGLSIFTRMQFVIIPMAFVGAALLFGILEYKKKWHRILKEQWLVLLCSFSLVVVGAAFGSTTAGFYKASLHKHVHFIPFVTWIYKNLYEMFWATGVVIMPLAITGLALALIKPRVRQERAFAALTISLSIGMLAESAYTTSGSSSLMYGRYLFYLSPLLIGAAIFYIERGAPWLLLTAVLSTAGLITTFLTPFADYTLNPTESIFLHSVSWLDTQLGGAFMTRPYFFPLAAVLLLGSLLSLYANKREVALGLIATGAGLLMLFISIPASLYIHKSENAFASQYLANTDRNWIEEAVGKQKVTFFAFGNEQFRIQEQMFWNPRIVLTAPEGPPIDSLRYTTATIDRRGRLLVEGQPVKTPLLALDDIGILQLASAKVVASTLFSSLWLPSKNVEFLSLLLGYYSGSHWLASRGSFTVWPGENGRQGYLSFTLLGRTGTSKLSLAYPGHKVIITLPPKERKRLHIRVCASGRPWRLTFVSVGSSDLNGAVVTMGGTNMLVSMKATAPTFYPSTQAC